MPHYKYMEDAERTRIDRIKAEQAEKEPTPFEKANIERIQLYYLHRELGSLGTYYILYPDDRPKSRSREDAGHER